MLCEERARNLMLLGLLLLHCLPALVGGQGTTTREEIIASREKRKFQLERVLDTIEKKLAAHRSGTRPLEEKQLAHLEHKSNAYRDQIEELDRELEDDEIQLRIAKAEEVKRAKIHQEL